MEKNILISMSVEEFQSIIIQAVNKCLSDKAQSPELASGDHEIMNVEEAAAFLNLAKGTLYKMTMSRELPFSKKGKRLYFMKSDLTEWVKSGKQKTYAEIEQEAINYLARKKR